MIRASSSLHTPLLPTPVREEARERETSSQSPTDSESPHPHFTPWGDFSCPAPAVSLPFLSPNSPAPVQLNPPPSPSLSISSSSPLPVSVEPPAAPLHSQPLAPGLYRCNKCAKTCEDTDIQALGCDYQEFYGENGLHPALIAVWPVCCGDCWSSLWNTYMGTSTQGEDL